MRRYARGFTLIELVLVVAIFLIVTILGFGMTRDTMPRYRAKKGALQFCRSCIDVPNACSGDQ